jgi:hypothetical protein
MQFSSSLLVFHLDPNGTTILFSNTLNLECSLNVSGLS